MKKSAAVVLAALILPAIALADKGTVAAGLGYFSPVFDRAFQDIYGGGPTFGADLTVNVWKNAGIWFGIGSFSRYGKLTFTHEDTELSLFSFVLGGNYTFFTSPVSLYAGLGVRLVLYNESNVLGDVEDLGVGFGAKIGIYKKIIAGLFADLYVGIFYCRMMPADFKINAGGAEAGIGIGYAF